MSAHNVFVNTLASQHPPVRQTNQTLNKLRRVRHMAVASRLAASLRGGLPLALVARLRAR
jgi:hypothetical protein